MKASKYRQNLGLERFFLFSLGIVLVLLSTAFRTNSKENQNDDKFTVVLDAGHGGHDPGNLGNGYKEKNIALNIVLKAGAILEQNPNIEVIYTRKDDTFVDLYVRGEIANKAGADLFVSVHCDSHTSRAHGAGTFVLGLHANKQNFEIAKKENSVIYLEDDYKSRYADYDIDSPESVIGLTIMQEEFLDQSIALAKAMQDNFSKKLNRIDRKVKQAGFIVLHQTFMPSVLVETGFLTNNEEGAYLDSEKGQEQMGTAIAEAVLTYRTNAMANIADLDPNLMAKAPDPESDAKKPKDRDVEREAAKKQKKEVAEKKRAEEIDRTKIAKAEKERAKEMAAKAAAVKEMAARERDAAAKQASETISEAEKKTQDGRQNKESAANERAIPAKNAEVSSSDGQSKEEIIYKVQVMATVKDLPLRPESFNGLSKVAQEPIENLYRYVYGSTSSFEEAKMLKSNADMKGYTTSFIVVYRNGNRITFKESKNYISKQ